MKKMLYKDRKYNNQSHRENKTGSNVASVFKKITVVCLCICVVLAIAMALIPAAEKPLIEGTDTQVNATIIAALSSCGVADNVEDIESVEHDEALDNMNAEGETGYRVTANGISNIILYMLNDNVNMVRYADYTLYENGEAVDNISNYALTEADEIKYYTLAEKAVKSVLVSPSSAEFGSIIESYMLKEDGIVTVQGYVDSQNALGAMLRSDFQVQFENDTPISLILDGTEYIQ